MRMQPFARLLQMMLLVIPSLLLAGESGGRPDAASPMADESAIAEFSFHGPYRAPTRGPVVATMRQALSLPAGDQWDDALTKAWGGYLLRHPYLIAAGNRSFQINARGWASLIKNL